MDQKWIGGHMQGLCNLHCSHDKYAAVTHVIRKLQVLRLISWIKYQDVLMQHQLKAPGHGHLTCNCPQLNATQAAGGRGASLTCMGKRGKGPPLAFAASVQPAWQSVSWVCTKLPGNWFACAEVCVQEHLLCSLAWASIFRQSFSSLISYTRSRRQPAVN